MTSLLAVLAGGLGGCVNQREYDKLWETNRSLQARNAELSTEIEDLRARLGGLDASGADAQSAIGRLQSENQTLRGQLASAQGVIADLESRLGNMSFSRLDPSTDSALRQLAARYPDLIVYDSSKGMLRFASDLTFRSGSDEVQPAAMDSLRALAGVLKSPEASGYDVIVVGHTDSQRISANTARRHPTNMHLSAHRAIAVRKALGDQGVAWEHMQAAGWGEYRPSVPNTGTGNTPQNRRVEIYLVASTYDGTPVGGGAPAEARPAAEPATTYEIEPTK
jgi:chemotaxis protein MotB